MTEGEAVEPSRVRGRQPQIGSPQSSVSLPVSVTASVQHLQELSERACVCVWPPELGQQVFFNCIIATEALLALTPPQLRTVRLRPVLFPVYYESSDIREVTIGPRTTWKN